MESEDQDSFEPTEEFSSIELYNKDSVNVMDELAVGQTVGSWNEFDRIELHNENWINVMDKLAFGRSVGSWDKFDNNELHNEGSTSVMDESAVGQTDNFNNSNENFTNVTDELAIRQIVDNQDELDCIESHDENLANRMDEPVVGQIFGCWNELDRYISFYAKSQNFVSVIRRSEYSNRICRSRLYACEHQGHNGSNKTSIAENQRQTRSKRIGCRCQVRTSCPKTTGILKINSVCLNHNDYQIRNETNKFALKYRTFFEDMLKDIKFWTEIGNINMRTQYQMLVKQYPDVFFFASRPFKCYPEFQATKSC
ncbi:hypothetical protein C2G38_2169977 [Gigaspora rosea]|uniref:FAR1 domain-containing protein n=1 Tax=Gigaspora rosea TaxID=44941 RepID=A0A397VN06_9GLOM|nr:hypothetical protein C2G38_2169977 [Gigaspora rosea]